MTRLSRIHPYPAMIADELAEELCEEFVKPGHYMLDPFCGTGRTLLAAANQGGRAIGVDVNPLATLIVKAKSSKIKIHPIKKLYMASQKVKSKHCCRAVYDLEPGRKVPWFSKHAKEELTSIIRFINKRRLPRSELFLVAAVLSATAREVSYSRKDQWKLHRMNGTKRVAFKPSAWQVFNRRLRAVTEELGTSNNLFGSVRVVTGDARNFNNYSLKSDKEGLYDLIITSPPYGDSYTTVQYGGMSGICLGVIRHLKGLTLKEIRGADIDNNCLGGTPKLFPVKNSFKFENIDFHKFWHGSEGNPASRSVKRFLLDIELSCHNLAKALKIGGVAVFVVSRRIVGGWRLKLDKFLIEILRKRGVVFETVRKRRIQRKISPGVVNRKGNTKNGLGSAGIRTKTMREELILVFRKKHL